MKTLTLLLSSPLLLTFLIECFPGSGPQSWRYAGITAAATTQSWLPTGPTAVQLPSSHACHWAQEPLLSVSSSANQGRQLFFFSIYKHACAFHTFIITPLYPHSIFLCFTPSQQLKFGLREEGKNIQSLKQERKWIKLSEKTAVGAGLLLQFSQSM